MKKSFEEKMKNCVKNAVKLSKEYLPLSIFRIFERVQLRVIRSFEKFPREFPKLENYSIH